MPSRLKIQARHLPRQERGERRVAALLEAASSVIAETGYDAATMSEIAERAGACIGSLYQFFPNKAAITDALRAKYCEEMHDLWVALEQSATLLTTRELVARLIRETLVFIDDRPALFPLFDAPGKKQHTYIRNKLRQRVARILLANSPHLPKSVAAMLAAVTMQIMKGMNELYVEAGASKSELLIQEFQNALTGYLELRIKTTQPPKGRPRRK